MLGFIMTLFPSCGLPSPTPVLEAPFVPSAAIGTEAAVFEHVPEGSNLTSDFRGYELFYKLYDSEASLESDRQEVESITEPGITTLIGTTGLGFLRVLPLPEPGVDPSSRPLLELTAEERVSSLEIAVDFVQVGDADDPTLSVEGRQEPITLARNNTANIPSGIERFFDPTAYDSSDLDVRDALNVEPGTVLYIAIVVVSFGRTADFATIYSEPVFLQDRELITLE